MRSQGKVLREWEERRTGKKTVLDGRWIYKLDPLAICLPECAFPFFFFFFFFGMIFDFGNFKNRYLYNKH